MSLHSTPPKNTKSSKLPAFSARDLTQQGKAAKIVLGDQTDTQRVTRAGKLVLTK